MVREARDAGEISSYLDRKRGYAAAAICHLEPRPFESSSWLVCEDGDRFALSLRSRAMRPSFLFTLGDRALLARILSAKGHPQSTYITCEPEHLEAIKRHYRLVVEQRQLRMVADRQGFTPFASGERASRLEPSHARALNRLYRGYSVPHISPSRLRRDIYYGVWEGDELAAAAGTHLIGPSHGVGYLGNVVTAPRHRNRGLATACASALTEELLQSCAEVALNVEPDNWAALRVYSKLGYREDCTLIEAMGFRIGLLGQLRGRLWRRKGGDDYER